MSPLLARAQDTLAEKIRRRRAKRRKLALVLTLIGLGTFFLTGSEAPQRAAQPNDDPPSPQTERTVETPVLQPDGAGPQTVPTVEDNADDIEQARADPSKKPAPAAIPAHKEAARLYGTDKTLAQNMQWLLDDYRVPEGAVVAIDIQTGSILAAAGRTFKGADVSPVHSARWPAASIFKIVTTSALLDGNLSPNSEQCFDGGLRRVELRDLKQNKGARCSSMHTAFALSQNVPYARWADTRLNRQTLTRAAEALGFGQRNRLGLPPTAVGAVDLPKDRLDLARAAVGFGDITMSPLHGAVLAAAIANEGHAPEPHYLSGHTSDTRKILPTAHAETIRKMMVSTVTRGSARKTFKERGRPALGKHGAGGKTGSLYADGKDLTWFVGFAPAENPTVAVAAFVANGPKWRIRASYVGREALRSAVLKTSPYRPTQDPHATSHLASNINP